MITVLLQKKAGPKARPRWCSLSSVGGAQNRRQRVGFVSKPGPIEATVGTVAVEAPQGVLARLDLVEDAHVALNVYPLVLEVLDTVKHVSGLTNCAIDIAVGEELLDIDWQNPAALRGDRHFALNG